MSVYESHQEIKAELKEYEKKVAEAIQHFSGEGLYALEHLLRGVRRRKPSNSFWHSSEVVAAIQDLVDKVVDAAIKKSFVERS